VNGEPVFESGQDYWTSPGVVIRKVFVISNPAVRLCGSAPLVEVRSRKVTKSQDRKSQKFVVRPSRRKKCL